MGDAAHVNNPIGGMGMNGGIQDAFMRAHGIDYFENSRRATYAHRAYSIENPNRSRSGRVIRPGRVVAPTNVNRGRSRRIERAAAAHRVAHERVDMDGESINAATVLWAAGVAAMPCIRWRDRIVNICASTRKCARLRCGIHT